MKLIWAKELDLFRKAKPDHTGARIQCRICPGPFRGRFRNWRGTDAHALAHSRDPSPFKRWKLKVVRDQFGSVVQFLVAFRKVAP